MLDPRKLLIAVSLTTLLGLVACSDEPSNSGAASNAFVPHSLPSYPNPFDHSELATALNSVKRNKPLEIAIDSSRSRAWVSLQGIPDEPGTEVVAIDLATHEVVARVTVGSSPTGLTMHPSGRYLLAFNRFSNFVSIIDTETNSAAQSLEVPYYTVEGEFSASGDRLFATNRWHDELLVFDVVERDGELQLDLTDTVTVGQNPRDLTISSDGSKVAVAALTGMTVTVVDTASVSIERSIMVGGPVNDLGFVGDFLVVATTSASTHHLPFAGPDTDGDGVPGDGTPNVNFQDLQNEIAVYNLESGAEAWRYTSDTICCKDYRDVDPRDTERFGDQLPPQERWIVGGALPEQLAMLSNGDTNNIWVSYSASNQLQRFAVNPATGELLPHEVVDTKGHNPHGVAVLGEELVVAHRLSETVGFYDAASGKHIATTIVGDVEGGEFPATDAEIGELFNYVTAPFSIDGDLSCAHCHREDGNIDKAFSMPLTRYGGIGKRMTMAYRGAADTRPWFFESSMDETNFRPVINEFARIENFCCSDYTLWTSGAPPACADTPPALCSSAPNPSSADGFAATRDRADSTLLSPRPSAAASRDEFFLSASEQLIGRTKSFGDGLFFEDVFTAQRQPIALNFDGITRALGVFLMSRTRLLPNPNPKTAATRRGEVLFNSLQTGCNTCHPAPSFAVSTDVNPLGLPLQQAPVVTPFRSDAGVNLDLLAAGFVQTFPRSRVDSCEEICGPSPCADEPDFCDDLRNTYLGVPSLRGIWDRADGGLLHDGRARNLREAIATPGHPGLRAGESGFNERDGSVDSHGGTSHLSSRELDDLVAFILTL